jgi:plastocyanin
MAKKTSRRALIKAAAAGGVVAGFGIGMTSRAATEAGEAAQDGQHDHHAPPVTGPMANATVSFGAWPADAANVMDRSPNRSPNNRNVHQLIPHEVTIKAGGTVNFIIAGFHWVAVYDNGTKPEDIDVPVFDPMNNPASLFINDPNNRIYRGLDPSTLTILTNVQPNPAPPLAPILVGTFYALGVRDRVEVVQFANPGRYLVICLINPHFKNPASGEFEMFGHVNVIP